MTLTEVLKEAGVTYEEALELHKLLIASANATAETLKGIRLLVDRSGIRQGTETFYTLQSIRWDLHESLMDDNDTIEYVFRHAFPWITKVEEAIQP